MVAALVAAVALSPVSLGPVSLSPVALSPVAPLPNAHSHNDYWRTRPLQDALEQGFTSIEADVFLIGTELQVGHDRKELRAGRTLESLYLEPLRRRVASRGGSVYGDGTRLILMIDIKERGDAVLPVLNRTLARYRSILDEVRDGRRIRRAVTIVLSGDRPIEAVASAKDRFVFLDGRPGDLGWDPANLRVASAPPPSADLYPMVSDAWSSHFRWLGTGPMPPVERARLRWMASRAKLEGRLLRFWASPPNEAVWAELEAAGVGLINGDNLPKLAGWLRRPRN